MCTLESIDTVLITIYRPPPSPEEKFNRLLEEVQQYLDAAQSTKHHDVYISGDFNLPVINWETHTIDHSQGLMRGVIPAKRLLDFMAANFLSQVVNKPTRGNNTLDLVLTNCPNYICEVNSNKTPLSDHNMVTVTFSFNWRTSPASCNTANTKDPFSFQSLSCYDGNFDKMNEDMKRIKWEELQELCNQAGDEDGSLFMELLRLTTLQIALLHCIKKKSTTFFPSRTKPKNKKRQVLKRRKRKLNCRLKAMEATDPNSPQIQGIKDKISLSCIDIRDAIDAEFYHKELKAVSTVKKNPRFFFSYAKKFSKLISNIGPLRDSNNELQTNPKIMAEILQHQYVSVFSDPQNQAIQDTTANLTPPGCSITDIVFSQEDIVNAIDEVDTYSSTSHECIPASILRACKHQLCVPIHMLWEHSFASGKVPFYLKHQFITPIHKKDSKAEPENYRPVSLTSHVIKVFERVIRNALGQYLENNFLLSEKQHGFRKGRSCLTQLLSHYDTLIRNLNKGLETDVIYLDFSKAFDKVDHALLLKKIQFYGIKGRLYDWIKDFLSNRKQIVTVDGQHSSPEDVTSGVPQGTVLGPLLFLLDANDLEEVVNFASSSSFADDTKLSAAIEKESDMTLLQNDLNKVVEWSLQNNMVLHEGKFEYLCYKASRPKWIDELPFSTFHYTTPAGFSLEPKDTVKDLGVILSSDYHWSAHINSMIAGARKLAGWALGVFRDRSTLVMLTIWKSLIRCKLEYCCPLWHPQNREDIRAIEDIQRFFTRHVCGLQDTDYWGRLKALKLQSLQRRRERFVIIHVWKLLYKKVPNDINMEFNYNERLGWKTRLPKLYGRTKTSTKTLYDASFSVLGAKLWNLLPKDVNIRDDLPSFKIHLGKLLDNIPDKPPVTGYTTQNKNSILDWLSQSGGLREKLTAL